MQIRKKRCAFEDGKMWKLKVGCVSLLSDGLRKAGMPIRLCKVYLELWLESGDRIFPTTVFSWEEQPNFHSIPLDYLSVCF